MGFSEQYTIEVPLGENEVGAVWRGRATEGGARVAIVMMEEDAPEEMLAHFREQAAKLTALRHPHIVHAIEQGDNDDGAPFVALELIEGESLAKRLTSGPALTVARAVEIVTQIAEGLGAAHAAGLVHGDVEPGNVLLTKVGDREVAKLIGFALNRADRRAQREAAARLSLPSLATQWAYAAPEQVRGETVASASGDLYSLAAVLFSALAGQPPHVAPDATGLLESIASGKPPALGSLKKELAPFSTIIERALSNAIEKRPADATAFVRGLKTASAFAKATHALPVPLGVRTPIGTPPAPKAAAAMPKPVMARPGAPGAAAAKPIVAARGVPKPAAAPLAKASDEQTSDEGSIELMSLPPPAPPPPPPPKGAKAKVEGADVGDIAVDTDEVALAAPATAKASEAEPESGGDESDDADAPAEDSADAPATSPESDETPGQADPSPPPEAAKADEAPPSAAETANEDEDEAPASASIAKDAAPEAPVNSSAGSEAAETATAPADPPKAAEAARAAADAPKAAEAPMASGDTPKAPEAAGAPADPPKAAEAARAAADAPKGAGAVDPVRPAAAAKAGDDWSASPAPKAVKPAKADEPAERPAPVIAALDDDPKLPSARPAWVLPAVGLGVLLVAALALFALRGSGEEDASTSGSDAPTRSEAAAGDGAEPPEGDDPGSAGAASEPSATEAPVAAAREPETPPEGIAGAAPEVVPGEAGAEPVPVEPVPAPAVVVAEPAPTPPPRAATATPPRAAAAPSGGSSGGTAGAAGSRRGSSSGSSRPPRGGTTSTAPAERPTVVADPGF